MKFKVQLKLVRVIRIISIGMLTTATIQTADNACNFDEILAATPYAALLKELICLTDTIGLLRHKIPVDEHRFIEDSVLGKTLRAKRLIDQVDFERTLQEDIDYLYYWLSVARSEPLSEFLHNQIAELEHALQQHVHKGLQVDLPS